MARERQTAPSVLAEIGCDVCAFYYDERLHFTAKLQQQAWDEEAAKIEAPEDAPSEAARERVLNRMKADGVI